MPKQRDAFTQPRDKLEAGIISCISVVSIIQSDYSIIVVSFDPKMLESVHLNMTAS